MKESDRLSDAIDWQLSDLTFIASLSAYLSKHKKWLCDSSTISSSPNAI